MSKQPAIIVDNVSMKFNLSKEKVDSLKGVFLSCKIFSENQTGGEISSCNC